MFNRRHLLRVVVSLVIGEERFLKIESILSVPVLMIASFEIKVVNKLGALTFDISPTMHVATMRKQELEPRCLWSLKELLTNLPVCCCFFWCYFQHPLQYTLYIDWEVNCNSFQTLIFNFLLRMLTFMLNACIRSIVTEIFELRL